MALYEIAILGSPTELQTQEFIERLELAAANFKLVIGEDIVLLQNPHQFRPVQRSAAAAIFFGGVGSIDIDVRQVLDPKLIPILPVCTSQDTLDAELPTALRALNCVFYDQEGPDRIFAALMSCVGLIPRKRRVFLSYRRDSATAAAVQLFAELSARHFDVFLDTHSIDAGEDFQDELWHRLCDVDVLLMLETQGYFDSRWTTAEYGRALAKGIGVLRVQWPDSTPSIYTGTASRVELVADEMNTDGTFATTAIDRISQQLEQVRITSHAVRHLSMVDAVRSAIERIQGTLEGIGAYNSMHIVLHSGRHLVVQPTIGVPSSVTLQEAIERAGTMDAAVVYDHLGIKPGWQKHMKWLGENVKAARWVKSTEAAWDFAGWET